jgi:hypothetical protein
MALATPSFSYCLSLHRQNLYSDGQFLRLNWDRSTCEAMDACLLDGTRDGTRNLSNDD